MTSSMLFTLPPSCHQTSSNHTLTPPPPLEWWRNIWRNIWRSIYYHIYQVASPESECGYTKIDRLAWEISTVTKIISLAYVQYGWKAYLIIRRVNSDTGKPLKLTPIACLIQSGKTTGAACDREISLSVRICGNSLVLLCKKSSKYYISVIHEVRMSRLWTRFNN